MALLIYPYRRRSRSARNLARLTGAKLIDPRYPPIRGLNDVVLNWGASDCPYAPLLTLNTAGAVRTAANKLRAFRAFRDAGVPIPEFTTDPSLVTWDVTVVRHKLTGHSGEGIELVGPESITLPEAPLYVEYLKKKHEYRVHVFRGDVIAQQRKARSYDVPAEAVNWQIRNHKNGFVFVREGVDLPPDVLAAAVAAVKALGLDFGAVDVLIHDGTPYVLEVNTAPGLEGATLEDYASKLKETF